MTTSIKIYSDIKYIKYTKLHMVVRIAITPRSTLTWSGSIC